MIFDFTDANRELAHLDVNDVSGFTEYLFETDSRGRNAGWDRVL